MTEQARSLIKRVRENIPDAHQRALASDILQMAFIAIEQFSQLDQTIYDYFADDGISLHEDDVLSAGLTEVKLGEVHATTFRAVRRLVAYLKAKGLLWGFGEQPAEEPNDDFDFGSDFDLCFQENGGKQVPQLGSLTIDDLEIDAVFDALADEDDCDSTTMYRAFNDQVATLGRLLVQETETLDRRVQAALDSHMFDLALRELDGSRQSLGEGLFALISTIFEVFGVQIERSDIEPSYKNALEQALLVRQGLADLSRVLTNENELIIKNSSMPAIAVKEAIGRVGDILQVFVEGNLCGAMRAPDRLELESFLRKIRNEPPASAALAVEGLEKYLESLSIVNQREVLVEHDKQVMKELRESLESARSLLHISFDAAAQMVRESLEQSEKLRGRNPKLDEQLDDWSLNPNLLGSPEDAARVIDIFDALIR